MSTLVNAPVFSILNMSTFKERLDEAVADAKLGKAEVRRELQKRLKMTRSNLSHWFSGRAKEPKGAAIAGAADYLGVSALWLAKGEGPKRTDGKEGSNKLNRPRLSEDAMEVAAMYDTMDRHVRELVRKHMRDVNEALGAPSAANPFGKGRRKPPIKKTGSTVKRKPPKGAQ